MQGQPHPTKKITMAQMLDNSALGAMVCEIINTHVGGQYHNLHINMDVEDFVKAVMLIATSNGCTAKYIVPVSDNYSNTYDILIQESNGRIIDELVKAGYSLSMTSKGLAVTKF